MRSCVLLLALLATASAKPKKKRAQPVPAPALPAAPEAPASPLDTVSPYDDTIPSPPLHGRTASLTLETLVRTEITFDFETDLSALDGFTGEGKDHLLRAYSTEPGWRVTRMEGSTVALRRDDDTDPTNVARTGYHVGDSACWRIAVRFTEADTPWRTADLVTRVKASESSMSLRGFTPGEAPCAGQLATALRAEGTVVMEIFESGSEDERPHTFDALVEVTTQMRTTARYGERQPIFPHETVESADTHASFAMAPAGPGQVQLVGTLNPGAPGWTFLRILDTELQPWEDAAVGAGSLERVGWSDDPTDRFYLQGSFPVPPGPAFSGTAEVWFIADGSDSPTKLDAIPITVPAR